ncbi:hypothetical protein WJX84_000566 [Apatococcus fuscideae]|uniref:Uncharacterized protein n=1 Tax=Apatococcus fuscideae TaxID=2026836 RepID=A0AAW1SKD6_9CHLO
MRISLNRDQERSCLPLTLRKQNTLHSVSSRRRVLLAGLLSDMAPRTRQQAQGKTQAKLEDLPATKPAGKKRKAAAAAAPQPGNRKSKADAPGPKQDPAGQAHSSGEPAKHESNSATATHDKSSTGQNGHSGGGNSETNPKLADDHKELDEIADKQHKAEAAEQLQTHKHQATLEQMPNTEGDPGAPKTDPDAGPHKGQSASHSKPVDVRKVDKPEVQVNRAPVITLWAAVVAQRQGHSRDAALTFGKYISGMLAQSKGRSIGIYEDDSKPEEEKSEAKRKEEEAGVQRVDVFGMSVKAVKVGEELRAAESNNKPSSPKATEGYLQRAFGDRYKDVEDIFKELAETFSPEDVAASGYKLYEKFRPSVPQGQRGWGAKGVLDLQYVLTLSARQ